MNAQPSRGGGSGLGDALGILVRQRWIVLACLALGAAAGAALVLSTRPVYQASALVRVDESQPRGGRAQQLDLAALLGDGGGVGTEIEVLRTRTLAAAVADSLALRFEVTAPRRAVRSRLFTGVRVADDAPAGEYRLRRGEDGSFAVEDAATGARLGAASPGGALRLPGVEAVLTPAAARHARLDLRVQDAGAGTVLGSLEVTRPSRDANVVRLTYRSSDPVLARDVPNVLAARFVELRQETHTATARSTARFLREQLDTIAGQLAASEEVLQSFQEGNNVVDLETEGRSELTQLAQVQAERGSLAVEHSSLDELLRSVDREAALQQVDEPSAYRRLAAFPALMRNQTTAGLLSSLQRVEDERAALLVRRKPADPEVQVLTARIRQLEGELRGMADTYRGALAGQISALDTRLGESRGRLDRIPAKELQFARLSRQPQVLAQLHSVLQAQLKEAEIAQAVEDPSVRVVDPAVLPKHPVSPRPKLILAGAFFVSLLLAFGIGYLREYTDETVHTTGDLELAIGAPVLALIPKLRQKALRAPAARALPKPVAALPKAGAARPAAAAPVVVADPITPEGDAYDWLHTNLLFATAGKELKTVLLTSAIPGEGKTTTAVNLAVSLAQRGERVLLIDADMRRGRVGAMLGAHGVPGLADVAAGRVGIEAVREADVGGGVTLTYMASGTLADPPTQLLRSSRVRMLLQWAVKTFDRVVIDSPPVHVVADAAVLAQYADGVVLVARSGMTPFGALAAAAEQLQKAGAPLLGGVINDVDYDRDARYDSAYRYYGYARTYYGTQS